MSKYIVAEKLIAYLNKTMQSYKSQMVDPRKYPIDHIDLMAFLAREYQAIIANVTSLQQEQPEWEEVDCVNYPLQDKDSLYCVLTKGRYLLAKVICHPQDDELLQWRCTEFPFRRYDMCEGDQYIKIKRNDCKIH